MNQIKKYIKDLVAEFQKDNVPLLAAAQAYYYLLSIVPLLIVCFSLIPYLNISSEEAMSFIETMMPGEMATIFEDNIVSLVETPKGGLLTVGIIGTLWSASNGINAFIKASNEAYEVEETRSFIKARLLALGLTLGLIVSVIIAMLLPVFGNVILEFVSSLIGLGGSSVVLFQVLRWAISIIVLTALLLILYRVAPNKKLPFKHVLPGALAGSLLWQLISLGFSFYVSNFGSYSATYGSLGGVIILMIWFFLIGIILMVGAEINVVYHRRKTNRYDYASSRSGQMTT
ncbi:YihY/virulence factor BrkB family protein [Alteribacillus iranensis]|uniref:Membrane protein n=1 Tax=Alteribacillus iranensis TaxID=930128 RepID=A0A1I2E903_9BACI|nr:YihY/virulence factor BrkB family protein [Alteribacillus iranensis]SFE89325.1 membrane protein [Alteribacillus iranensis]